MLASLTLFAASLSTLQTCESNSVLNNVAVQEEQRVVSEAYDGFHGRLKGVNREQLPDVVMEEEFNPESGEGTLFKLSSIDTLEEVEEDKRGEREYIDNDTTAVKKNFMEIFEKYRSTTENHAGMREFRASILGSGDLTGIPLDIMKDFTEVDLYDAAPSATYKALRKFPELSSTASVIREDITGLLPSFRWKCEYLFGIVDTPKQAFSLLRKYIDSDRFYPKHLGYDVGYNSSLRSLSTSDVIVVNTLFHELGDGFVRHLSTEMRRLKQEAWPGMESPVAGLGGSVSTLSAKLRSKLVDRIKYKISLNPNRVLLILLTLDRSTRYSVHPVTGALQFPHILRKGNSERNVIQAFNTSEAVTLHDSSATMVSYRVKEGERLYAVEETVRATAFTYHNEFNMEQWLESLRSGNAAMWAG
eukprot:TRINITY_DN30661_c0_g1_i1.p1 TRINITY_DN30661_c0_g1~~TRINITY_DN30661_c0_g1_i1.p1  ORF type:complete len:417 (+),score=41.89 TRINITY_DN30661_c0_g1_i1:55-1305(+)